MAPDLVSNLDILHAARGDFTAQELLLCGTIIAQQYQLAVLLSG